MSVYLDFLYFVYILCRTKARFFAYSWYKWQMTCS